MISNIKARALIKALGRDGFELKRTSGSHRVYKHQDGRRIVVAYHHFGEADSKLELHDRVIVATAIMTDTELVTKDIAISKSYNRVIW